MSFKELGQSLVLSSQCSLLQDTAPCRMSLARRIRHPCPLRHPCCTLPCLLCQQGLLCQWVIMVRAISSLLCLTPIGYLRESRCYNISSFRNGSNLKLGELAKPSLSLGPPISSSELPIKVGDDVEIIAGRSASAKRARPEDQATDKAKRARSTSTSRRSPSPKRDYPRGTCTATRPSQASPKLAEHRPAPAQDLKAFKADMTLMLSDMLQSSLSKFASQFNPSSGSQGDSVPTQTVTSLPMVDVASDREDIPPGPKDQSERK